jgi:hypothetical protein
LQEENARLKKELLARGPPTPGAPGPDFKLPSDADVVAFLEKAWRRLIEMGRTVLKDSREEKLRDFFVR